MTQAREETPAPPGANREVDPSPGLRIGLIRHFPVRQAFPTGWRTAKELSEWYARYDLAEASVVAYDLGRVPWKVCLSSDLPRARFTAGVVYPGSVETTALLREARLATFGTGALRLPVWMWRWVLRISWMTGHRSQRACRDDLRARVAQVSERLEQATEDTLVVSHAGMMAFLSEALRRRGFKGPRLRVAEHAKTYVYERTLSP